MKENYQIIIKALNLKQLKKTMNILEKNTSANSVSHNLVGNGRIFQISNRLKQKGNRSFFTVLKSPFVYKKSRTQVQSQVYEGSFNIQMNEKLSEYNRALASFNLSSFPNGVKLKIRKELKESSFY
jgi:ribosomal protein S10